MLSSHRFLPLAQVASGMTLSDDLLDAQGKVLLPGGTVLTQQMLARLPAHGVQALPIVVAAPPRPPVDRDAVMQRIAHIFRKTDPFEPAMFTTRQLRRFVENYRLEELGE